MLKYFILLFFVITTTGASAQKAKRSDPFLADAKLLARNKKKISQDDAELAASLKLLQQRADEALEHGPYSVIYKSKVPPSGDKHDYMSVGPYWWPDSTKADGLPYIRRDGVVNPERHTIKDADHLKLLARDVKTLALTYYFTGQEKYAARAGVLLRAWFLDRETKMNPNLNYGQSIPGITDGRGIGLIDTKCFVDIVDGVQLLSNSPSWTKADHQALQAWFGQFLNWLLVSPIGKDEADEHNNHGVYYDLQAVSLALFTGKPDLARKILQEQSIPRVASQIKEDGSQPHELARTKSWSYASMNLKGFLALARLGEHVGIDLWNYKTAEGKGIKRAFEWMLPYAMGEKNWTHEQIEEPIDWNRFRPLLLLAEPHYPDARVSQLINRLKPKDEDDRIFTLTNTMFY